MKKPATKASAVNIDRTDRAILRQLQRDASISNVALAAKVNLSAPACLRRVERLREAGLIRATVALLDPKALDARVVHRIREGRAEGARLHGVSRRDRRIRFLR